MLKNLINKKKESLRILLICQTMSYFSGSPLYNYTLALELKKQGHDVCMFSMWADNELQENLGKSGIMTCYTTVPKGKFDLVLISQQDHKYILDMIEADKIINIIHSEYDVESPIVDKKIDEYVAIRPQIKEHLINEHNIPENKIRVIYNGVDFERFSEKNKKSHEGDYFKVVLPCTLDTLRVPFLEYYANKANEKYRVYIYGKNYGHNILFNKWVYVNDEVFDIENYIADADIVAGILLGRINLEARAMGILSFIHDPENPTLFKKYFPKREDFDKMHNVINVAKQIIS